jgi:hypothetical protein
MVKSMHIHIHRQADRQTHSSSRAENEVNVFEFILRIVFDEVARSSLCMYVCMYFYSETCVGEVARSSLCMYVCMYVCMHAYAGICMYVCVCSMSSICMYVCMHVYMYESLSLCMYVFLCMHAYMYAVYVCVYSIKLLGARCPCMYMHMNIHACMHACTHTHTCMHACMNIYIHT